MTEKERLYNPEETDSNSMNQRGNNTESDRNQGGKGKNMVGLALYVKGRWLVIEYFRCWQNRKSETFEAATTCLSANTSFADVSLRCHGSRHGQVDDWIKKMEEESERRNRAAFGEKRKPEESNTALAGKQKPV